MGSPNSFKLPKSFLTQLGEFTTGYLLISVNESGEFETFIHYDGPVVHLGMLKFARMIIDTLDVTVAQTKPVPGPAAIPDPTSAEEGNDGPDDGTDDEDLPGTQA